MSISDVGWEGHHSVSGDIRGGRVRGWGRGVREASRVWPSASIHRKTGEEAPSAPIGGSSQGKKERSKEKKAVSAELLGRGGLRGDPLSRMADKIGGRHDDSAKFGAFRAGRYKNRRPSRAGGSGARVGGRQLVRSPSPERTPAERSPRFDGRLGPVVSATHQSVADFLSLFPPPPPPPSCTVRLTCPTWQAVVCTLLYGPFQPPPLFSFFENLFVT